MDELNELKSKLENETLDFETKLEVKSRILDLEYELGIKEKPEHTIFECVGCSS